MLCCAALVLITPQRTACSKPPKTPRLVGTYSMPLPSFTQWLEHRLEEVPDAAQIALLITRSGTAGVSKDRLCKVIGSSPETLESMLRALVTARQVMVVKVGGELVYRTTG